MSSDSLFWREPEAPQRYVVPEDVHDLVFRVRGDRLEIDHALALAEALRDRLGEAICSRIGVHGVRLADSGNGWIRPDDGAEEVVLPRRARLAIRVHRDDHAAVEDLSHGYLDLGDRQLQLGEARRRELVPLGSLHARGIRCDAGQSEPEFLSDSAASLRRMGIDVARMICGRSREIRGTGERLFTRSLMIADLKPEESVRLQQHGLGEDRLLGCGLFVPHKGIDPVFSEQE